MLTPFVRNQIYTTIIALHYMLLLQPNIHQIYTTFIAKARLIEVSDQIAQLAGPLGLAGKV